MRARGTRALRTIVVALAASALVDVGRSQAGTTSLVSQSSAGVQGDKESRMPAVSADGRTIAFESRATNLVAGDTNGVKDVFVRDVLTGLTERVSVSSSGVEGDNESLAPSISADGRYVVYASSATNLVAGDTNASWDVFLHDRLSATTTRVSVGAGGAQASGASLDPELSDDGLVVAFTSNAPDLVAGDTNGADDVFVRNLVSGVTVRASVGAAGAQASGPSRFGALDADGNVVAFASLASDLVAGDTNAAWDVFVRDLVAGTTTRVSVSSTGTQGDAASRYPSLSADGSLVAFASLAHTLVSGDGNGSSDVFVHDRNSGVTTLESVNSAGVQGDDGSEFPSLSADGLALAFMSFATNLVPGDFNGATDVFVRERASGVTTRESVDSSGVEGDSQSFFPVASADGSLVAFMSLASNLFPGDGNVTWDVLLRERGGCSAGLAVYCTASTTSIAGCQASIGSTGTPLLSSPTAFTISSGAIPGGALGILYFGVSGPDANPIGTQGGFVCVASPALRAPAKPTGGASGTCTGQLAYTLQELLTAHPGVLLAGTTAHTAFWFRDPPSPDTFALSNGLRFTVCQ